MKKALVTLLSFTIVVLIATCISSCGEERSTPPNIAFVTDTTRYIFNDTALLHGTVFNVAITASKTGTEGMLSAFTVQRSLNGGADSTIQEINMVQQSFAHIFTYVAPDSASVHRYTFTAAKRDGQTNSLSLTISGI